MMQNTRQMTSKDKEKTFKKKKKKKQESRNENEEVRIINRKKIKVVSIIIDQVKTIHERN